VFLPVMDQDRFIGAFGARRVMGDTHIETPADGTGKKVVGISNLVRRLIVKLVQQATVVPPHDVCLFKRAFARSPGKEPVRCHG